jgi:hypothetical protein
MRTTQKILELDHFWQTHIFMIRHRNHRECHARYVSNY